MGKTVLVRGARQLLTFNGPREPRRGPGLRNLGIIEDGSVLIVNGVIAQVGPTRRVENLAEARTAEEVDATGRVVLPAFVDSNTQLIERADPPGGENENGEQVRARPSLRRRDQEARRILEGCVRHGSGTVETRSGFGIDENLELRTLRVAANLDQRPANVVPAYGLPATRPDHPVHGGTYIDWLDRVLLPRIQSKRLAQLAGIDCTDGDLSLDDTRRLIEVCQRHGLTVRIRCEEKTRIGVVPLAVSREVLALEGLTRITRDDAAALAASPVLTTLLPAQTLEEADRAAAAARMLIDAGVAVTLASGFRHHHSGTFNMQMVIALAVSSLRMTTAEAISAATINAAFALQVADRVGSLQFGKDGDLLILNVSDYREMSWYFGVNLVWVSMRRGRILYREAGVQSPAA
jgi:imidazolonepropionase